MGSKPANCGDHEIARLAAGQHGVVLLAQLAAAGITQRAVSRRVQSGRLHRIHRGVYAVGHWRLSKEGVWLAAVLACGTGAVLSHRSAAALWRIIPQADGPTDVVVPGHGGAIGELGSDSIARPPSYPATARSATPSR